MGYIYWKLGKYDKAADVYNRGSQLSDAPPFMKLMAASMTNEGGSRDTARAMYQQMYDQSDDQQTKNNAEFRLMEFDSQDELDAIRSVFKTYSERNGACPQSLSDILPSLRSVQLPKGKNFRVDAANNLVDPSGSPYLIDRVKCEVTLDPQRTKLAQQ